MTDYAKHTSGKPYVPVIIVGGGHAGLSIAYYLKERNIDYLIFEKHRIAHAWRAERWDSFCLVTPNWQCQLPGFPYAGPDPHGFIAKDEIIAYIEAYAALIKPPLREGVAVTKLRRGGDGLFDVSTTEGDYVTSNVVVAIGGYHVPSIPRLAERLPKDILQIHSSAYRNPQCLPDGEVLVVGSGQSGCQIAEDLHLAGRRVHLSVGSAPRAPRVYRGRDAVEWLHDMGHYDLPVDRHPLKEKVRGKSNHYLTGRDGGREIDLRRFALEGMQLYGRLADADGTRLFFRPDLKQNLDAADAVYTGIRNGIDQYIAENGIATPLDPPYEPVWAPTREILEIDCRALNITSLIWSTGFRTDFKWIEIPVFDGSGYPGHVRGVTGVEGLYFLGLPWLYTWGSGRFSGIARDALYIADRIDARTFRQLKTTELCSPLLELYSGV